MLLRQRVLPTIVLAQFCCTSMWFAGNAVMGDLLHTFDLAPTALSHLTSAVQFGFILGTLVFALLAVADRFSPSKVFFVSAVAGAAFNLGTIWDGNDLYTLLGFRFLVGFSLAGIYPVGMKLAADHFQKGLGKSLGWLVGALVVGTAFPHLLKSLSGNLPWRMVMVFTSAIALTGGALVWMLVPNGPFRLPSQGIDLSASFRVFRNPKFRAAAFGYFGHMWELYAFWAFVPLMLAAYNTHFPEAELPVSALSFAIIAIGGLSCVLGGYISQKQGVKQTATWFLGLSGLCCLLSPWLLMTPSIVLMLSFLFFWGMVVIADSPLFSTLVAQNAPSEWKGTALTIVNGIGFALTIFSIQLLSWASKQINPDFIYWVLLIGPLGGVCFLLLRSKSTTH